VLSHLTERRPGASPAFDVRGLDTRLRDAIEGEVRFDDGSRALYATDASNYRQVPIGVVIPRSVEDVIATVEVCREFNAPILSRGGGTSLCGQCCNVAVVIDFSKYLNRILEIDAASKSAWVEPGVVLDDLRAAAERHHLTFAPDPSTHNHNTLGGMIGNNSCGVHSVMGGETSANILALDVLTYDGARMRLVSHAGNGSSPAIAHEGRAGQIHAGLRRIAERYGAEIRRRFPAIPRRVSGYNLPALLPENGFDVARSLVGSEGTCVIVLGAKVRLVDSPPARTLLVLGYPDVYSAGDHIEEVLSFGPIGLEGIDEKLIEDMKAVHLHPRDVQLLPAGHGWLLVEFGGASVEESRAKARDAMRALAATRGAPSMKLFDDREQERLIWEVRESGLGATAHVPNKPITWEGWEDAAVPPARLGDYLRGFRALLEKYGYDGDLYGHFGQGCVHTRIDFDLATEAGIRTYRAFAHEAAALVARFGGSISGEHGDGQSKAELLPIMFGPEIMQAFRDFKALWDPGGRMNPGKVIDAHKLSDDLRLGAAYRPVEPTTTFRFPDDSGRFARALLRCVGVGDCRKHDSGTMCPSYMATREEQHSTRGRARLLFEALEGNVLRDRWHDESVKEALDLCLSCKGCKGECPVHVDMATLRAEFLSHYYEGRRRPRQAYAFGYIDRWARLAAVAPRMANFFLTREPFAGAARALTGVAAQRALPVFAHETFDHAFRRRRAPLASSPAPSSPSLNSMHRRILLWPDTFNNHWHPQTLAAAVFVLEQAGCDVQLPNGHLCCGRPLYEFGLLDTAVRYLQSVLHALRGDIEAGTPLIVLEPACAAVFRDELPNLMPENAHAQRLAKQTLLLSEFLARVPDYTPPQVASKAVVHGHCMHKAVLKMDAEIDVLRRMGLDLRVLDSGCCGMAGSFGFDKNKYDISMRIGERVLLPAVRESSPDTLIVADGYSCREQIAQSTDRRALHFAEVIAQGLGGAAPYI
jgi:FAD/FMN-containing dehydrogenase/Fe-S oxidoreductase